MKKDDIVDNANNILRAQESLEAYAKRNKQIYDAYINAGFTDEQALSILNANLYATVMAMAQKDISEKETQEIIKRLQDAFKKSETS